MINYIKPETRAILGGRQVAGHRAATEHVTEPVPKQSLWGRVKVFGKKICEFTKRALPAIKEYVLPVLTAVTAFVEVWAKLNSKGSGATCNA